MYPTLSLYVNANASGKNLTNHLCARNWPRLIFIVPSAINPPFANNDWNEPYLGNYIGIGVSAAVQLIRFSGVPAPNAA